MGILESLVTPFIKDIMGKYFSNFDSSKLDIGLGNVELNEMLVRPGLFDDMGIPLKLVFGKVGKIYIEIAISTIATNMWSSRDVVVTIKDVYVLLAPPTSVRFQNDDADKKAKKRQDLEKAIESDPKLGVGPAASASDPSLVIGIINNIKVTVENIHIRYEDETTNPSQPFSFGITLKSLKAVSTDNKWTPTPTDKYAETFYKLVGLEGLGVYWNSGTGIVRPRLPSKEAQAASIAKMQKLLSDDNHELKYMIGPLSGDAKAVVTLNPSKIKPAYSKPMADIALRLEGFNIDITNDQFHDSLLLMESLEDMSRRKPFLEFRPFGVPYDGYAKNWWSYAYKCIRVGVARRNRIYDPKYLVNQRRLCVTYEQAYAEYRQKSRLKEDVKAEEKKISDLEDQIPNQDILLIRKRVAFKDEEVEAKQESKWGWTGSYKLALDSSKLKQVLAEKLTPEEMKELEEMINLEPSAPDSKDFPPGYTQINFDFQLPKFVVTVRQAQSSGRETDVLQLVTTQFTTKAKVLPAEKGLWVELEMSTMNVTGLASGGEVPSMARDLTDPDQKFVSLTYEKNPAEKKTGKYITIRSDRVEIVYDAPTIQRLIDCFTWPTGVELAKTKAVMGDAMKNAKNMSVAGLKDMIQNTEEIYVDISCKGPYLMLPSGGNMKKADTILVVNSGNFTMTTIPRERSVTDGHDIHNVGSSEDGDISDEIMKLTYNQYVATHSNLEVYIALKGEDITSAINHTFPPSPEGIYHLDRPVMIFSSEQMQVNVNQCIIADDTRFPKIKLEMTINLLDFTITDFRAIKLVKLVATIPMPVMKPPPPSAFIQGADDDIFTDESKLEQIIKDKEEPTVAAAPAAIDSEHAAQFTNLLFHLNIKLAKILLLRLNEIEKSTTPLLDMNIARVDLFLKFRSYGMSADITCGSANAAYLNATVPNQEPGTPVYMLKTPDNMNRPLIKLHVFSISEACPRSEVGDVRQKVFFDAQCVDVILHQESLEGLLVLGDRVLHEFTTSKAAAVQPVENVAPTPTEVAPTLASPATEKKKEGRTVRIMKAIGIKNLPNAGDILMKSKILFADFSISLTSSVSEIAKFHLGELIAEYEEKPLRTRIYVQVKDVEMSNLVKPSYYSRIMSTGTDEPFVVANVLLHKETITPTEPDIEVQVQLKCPPIICMGDYIGEIVDFFGHLLEAHQDFMMGATVEELPKEEVALPKIEVAPGEDVAPTRTLEIAPPTFAAAAKPKGDQFPTAKKLSLDIKLTSPKLIIVKGTMSPEAVVLDLGNLVVKNSLKEFMQIQKHSVIMDDMDVTLEGLSISRVIMDTETQEIKSTLYLLEPVLLKINLQRSLSTWCKQLPDFEVNGDLQPTALRISSLDVEVAATCILNYVNRVKKSLAAIQSLSKQEPDPEEEEPEVIYPHDLILGGEDEEEEPTGPDTHKIGVKFTVVQVGLFLYQQPTLLDGVTGLVPRDPAGSLAEFYMDTMDVMLRMFHNGDLGANIILMEFLLRDSRPNTGDIKDFLLKKETATNKNLPIVQFGISISKSKDDTPIYDIHSTNQGMVVILYLEFLKLVLEFVLASVKSLPKSSDLKLEDDSVVQLDSKKKKPSMKALGIKAASVKLLGGQEEEEEEEEEEEPVLPLVKANVKFSETEFLLLESTKSSDTNALILYGNSSFLMDSEEGEGSHGNGSWDFGIITAKYSPDKPKEQVCHVLEPVKMEIKVSLTPTAGTDVALDFSDTLLHINAGTVLLVTKFAKSFKEVVDASNKDAPPEATERKDYSDIWNLRENGEQSYWFLDVPALTRTVNRHKLEKGPMASSVVAHYKKLPEIFKLNLSRWVVIVEAGISTKPTAMLLIDGHTRLTVQNWSLNLRVQANIGLCVYYNNITKGAWEYLLEPNDQEDGTVKPWDLDLLVTKSQAVSDKSAYSVTLSSDDVLEVTVSKSSIDLLKALGQNFTNCLHSGVSEKDINTPPYVFQNDASTDIFVTLPEGQTGLMFTTETTLTNGSATVHHGETLEFGMKLQDIKSEQKDRLLEIYIPEFQEFRTSISAKYNGTAYHKLTDNAGQSFGMLIDIKGKANFSTSIVARSVVQLTSELSLPVEVSTIQKSGQAVAVGVIQPGQSKNFPLSAVHEGIGTTQIVFTPLGFQVSAPSTVLSVLAKSSKAIDIATSKSTTEGVGNGKIRIIGSVEGIAISGGTKLGRSYSLVLKPPLIVNNFLPITLEASSEGKLFVGIPSGTPLDLLTVNPDSSTSQLHLRLSEFQGDTWTASLRLRDYVSAEIGSIPFKGKAGNMLYFRFRPTFADNKLAELSVFCPYWMINRTGLKLAYQCESSSKLLLEQDATEGPKLMAYDIAGEKLKAKFKIAESAFSKGLNLDAPMSVDFVCKGKKKDYAVVVSVELCPSSLTKTVSFIPKHTICNTCSFDVLVADSENPTAEILVPAKSTVPFWPDGRTDAVINLVLRVADTKDYSPFLKYDGVHMSLLKLPNKYGGVLANVNVLPAKGTLTISEFDIAGVPILIVNDTADLTLVFNQAEVDFPITVQPRKSAIYTWDDMAMAESIEWTVDVAKGAPGFPKKFDMNAPSIGALTVADKQNPATKRTYNYSAFVSGQRTIFVITDNSALVKAIQGYLRMGKSDDPGMSNPLSLELIVQLEGIGISVVDDQACKDVIYLRLDSTPAMWEATTIGGSTYRNVPPGDVVSLEKGYLNYIMGKNTKRPVTLDNGMKIDYSNYKVSAPKAQQLKRREQSTGIFARLRLYEFSKEVKLSIAKLQIDNQLEGTEYKQLFITAPMHKSAANKTEIPPPLFILDAKDRKEGASAETISGTVVLQEFYVSVDTTFLKNIIAIFAPDSKGSVAPKTRELFELDQQRASLTDKEYFESECERISAETSIAYYELVEIYKLKLHVSASVSPDPESGFFTNMLLGIGASTISVTDAAIDVDGLKITKKRWTKAQLTDAVIQHYKSGLIGNIYKLVLGLDLLGNPTKLLSGIGSGLSALVTEPLNGAMSGNLIEGISNGAEAAIGGTIFGVTDALGTLTKSLGKLTKGLGLFGVHNLLGGVSDLLLGIGGSVGEKKPDVLLRPRRIMFPNQPLKPYSMSGNMGDTLYKKVTTEFSDCGAYVNHFVCDNKDGSVEILMLTVMRAYCASAGSKLEFLDKKWSLSWTEVTKVVKNTNNEVVFKQPPAKGWFSADKEQKAKTSSPAEATAALRVCKQLKGADAPQ